MRSVAGLCGPSQDVNEQLEICQWGPVLDESDDSSILWTNLDDDTVFTNKRIPGNNKRVRRAVEVIKKHASRLGVSGADLLRHPGLLQAAHNQQKKGAEAFDDDSSEDLDDASLGSDVHDDAFLSLLDDNTTPYTTLDDETLNPHISANTLHMDGSANSLLATDNVVVPIYDKYHIDQYELKTDLSADTLCADQGVESRHSSGKKGKKTLSKLKKHLASIRFRRQTRDPANVKPFFCDEKRS